MEGVDDSGIEGGGDDKKKILDMPILDKNIGADLQIYHIVTGKDPSWQGIIYELITTDQIDPWNVDIGRLCSKYFEKIKELEEENFFISSKILLAAAFLLRIKSDFLLNRYMKEVDDVLFGRKEEENILEREIIYLDEDEIPILIPKSPLPRTKRVTLQELITALDQAINTESRRINKEIQKKQAERLSQVDIPKFRRINIRDRIRHFYARILSSFNHPDHKDKIRLPYSHFTNNSKEEKIACFLPLLYLSNNNKLWLEQEKALEEIYVYLYKTYKDKFPDRDLILHELEEEIEELKIENKDNKRVEEINKDFENPIGDLIESFDENIVKDKVEVAGVETEESESN